MKVRFTDEAYECLGRIEDSFPKNGKKIVLRIVEKTDLLVDNPQLGRMVPERGRPDLRELIEHGHRVFYVIDVDEIRILTIFHGSALPPDVKLDPVDDD